AEIAVKTVPGCELEVQSRPGADQRTYRTDFGKFARVFPDFEFRGTRDGARDLYEALRASGITRETFADKRFTRLRWLSYLLDSGQLDTTLRWTNGKRQANHDCWSQDHPPASNCRRARQDHAHAQGHGPALYPVRRDLLLLF